MPELIRKTYQYPTLSNDDVDKIIALHKRTILPKTAFLLKAGEVSKQYFILEKGLIRSYVKDHNGKEITTNFYSERDLVIEVSSLFQGLPTEEYFQALTDCILWEIKYEDFQEAFMKIPSFAEWGRSWMANTLSRQKLRMIRMITVPASIRYRELLRSNPDIMQNSPLKHIASYLGITDTSLSRIRREFLHETL